MRRKGGQTECEMENKTKSWTVYQRHGQNKAINHSRRKKYVLDNGAGAGAAGAAERPSGP